MPDEYTCVHGTPLSYACAYCTIDLWCRGLPPKLRITTPVARWDAQGSMTLGIPDAEAR